MERYTNPWTRTWLLDKPGLAETENTHSHLHHLLCSTVAIPSAPTTGTFLLYPLPLPRTYAHTLPTHHWQCQTFKCQTTFHLPAESHMHRGRERNTDHPWPNTRTHVQYPAVLGEKVNLFFSSGCIPLLTSTASTPFKAKAIVDLLIHIILVSLFLTRHSLVILFRTIVNILLNQNFIHAPGFLHIYKDSF